MTAEWLLLVMGQMKIMAHINTCEYFGPNVHPDQYMGNVPQCGKTNIVGKTAYCEEHYPLIYTKRVPKTRRARKVDPETLDDTVIITRVFRDREGDLQFSEVVI